MNTVFLLLAEYETGDIPLHIIGEKYFGFNRRTTTEWALGKKFPFPVFRAGSAKSEWLVSVQDFAVFLDEKKSEARNQIETLKKAS